MKKRLLLSLALLSLMSVNAKKEKKVTKNDIKSSAVEQKATPKRPAIQASMEKISFVMIFRAREAKEDFSFTRDKSENITINVSKGDILNLSIDVEDRLKGERTFLVNIDGTEYFVNPETFNTIMEKSIQISGKMLIATDKEKNR